MAKIRKICEMAFEDISEIDKLMNHSTPWLLKLVDVLRQYKPEHVSRTKPVKYGNSAEVTDEQQQSEKVEPTEKIDKIEKVKPRGGRYKGGYSSYDDPNALCTTVFVQDKFTGNILKV